MGDEYELGLANYGKAQNDTAEVGSYPKGASPYGALDMLGNVWEWVDDPSVNDMDYVFMGGSWLDIGPLQRAAGAVPENPWSFGVHSKRMRMKFSNRKRRILLLHRNGKAYMVGPLSGRMRLIPRIVIPKLDPYR